MPSRSKKQHNLMEGVAHDPAFAKKVGIKQSVGQDFVAADKGRKFADGGKADETEKPSFLGTVKDYLGSMVNPNYYKSKAPAAPTPPPQKPETVSDAIRKHHEALNQYADGGRVGKKRC